jgi:hypothetical protein
MVWGSFLVMSLVSAAKLLPLKAMAIHNERILRLFSIAISFPEWGIFSGNEWGLIQCGILFSERLKKEIGWDRSRFENENNLLIYRRLYAVILINMYF